MFQFILLAAIIYILYKWIRGAPPARRQSKVDHPPPATGQVEEMVQDPVCGTWIPVSQALTANRGGETFYFCSSECRDKFLKSRIKDES